MSVEKVLCGGGGGFSNYMLRMFCGGLDDDAAAVAEADVTYRYSGVLRSRICEH